MPIEVRRISDDVLLGWKEHHLVAQFSSLRESDAGLIYGELSLESSRPPKGGPLVKFRRLCLNQPGSALKQLSEYLTPRHDDDWQGVLSVLIDKTIETFREPPPLVDLADTVASPQTEYLFEPLLPLNETTVIMADRASGKSYLAQGLGLSVVSNTVIVPGLKPTRHGTVIYYDFETGQAAQWRRGLRISNGAKFDGLPRGLKYREMHGAIATRIKAIIAEVERTEAVLVIIDSLGWAAGADLNNNEVAIRTMDAIRQIPCTRLVIAHYAKGHRNGDGAATVFGSAFFENAPRAVWEVRNPTDEPKTQLTLGLFERKMSDDEEHEPFALRITWDKSRNSATFSQTRLAAVAELDERLPLHERLRNLLRQGDRDTVWLAEKTGSDVATARKTLGRMSDVVPVSVSVGGRSNAQNWHLQATAEEAEINRDTLIDKSVPVSVSDGALTSPHIRNRTENRDKPDVSRNGAVVPFQRSASEEPSEAESDDVFNLPF